MMFIGYFVIGLCALRQFGVQATILVTVEDISILKLDSEYFDSSQSEAYITEDDEGDSTINLKLKIVKTLPEKSEAHFALLGLSMGVYNVPTGLDVTMKLCDIVAEPIIMEPFFKILGFTEEMCPPKPDSYVVLGYKVPVEKLPDEFIENKYQATFELGQNRKTLMSVKIIVDVQNLFER